MTLQPGDQIGPYKVLALIGVGGMGEVYRAHDLRLGRDVALKTLPAMFVADPERVARFEREARVLATLNHPNIAAIHGFERQDGVVALAMELVDGETLDDRIWRSAVPGRGLTFTTTLHIARQIIAALDAAHEKNIIHRDLKPANIKVTADDDVKVLDFGLARSVDRDLGDADASAPTRLEPAMTQVGVVLGTAAYMSPEQARGLTVDRRTDIWAFGCILYEMLSGRPAFAGPTATDTIAAVLTAEIDFAALPADTPASLRSLVVRCLERSTKSRLRDIADARLHLDAVTETGIPTPKRPGFSRRSALLTGSAALGLLAVGGAGGGALVARRTAVPATTPSYQRLTFRRGLIRTARFGPDFKTVYYGALWDGDVCRVHSLRPESPESSAMPLPPAAPLAVSSAGELALALGTHQRGIMTYGTLAKVPVTGGAPRPLQEDVKYADWSPNGQALAIVRRVGAGDQLEFPAGTVIAQPDTPSGGFSFPRVSPRGDAVAVFELTSATGLEGRVVVVDRSGAKRAMSATYFNVFGLAWKGEDVWFTAADDLPLSRNAIHSMNVSGVVRIVARVPGNASLHDIAPDGRALLARTDDRGGITVQVPGEATARDFSWLDAAVLGAISIDGRQILFHESGVGGGPRGSLYLRGTDGSLAVRLGDGRARALSADGRWAIAQTDAADLDVIPTGPGQIIKLGREGLRLSSARFLGDGRQVLARGRQGDAGSRLYLLDLNGVETRPVTPEGLAVGFAGWAVSPDGDEVAVSNGRRLELFPIAGGSSRKVPGDSDRFYVLGWTRSGLLVSEDPPAGGVVSLLDPATGRRTPWADIRPQDPAGVMNMDLFTLVVTPDGRGYGYSWHRASSDLYLVTGLS